MSMNKKTTDALKIMHRRYYTNNPQRQADLEKARMEDSIAQKIFALREKAGLTQPELAELVGTTASVICRLEDAEYEGHSLSMLNRMATALNMKINIEFIPAKSAPTSTDIRQQA